jgi:hypothetical protein
MLPRLHFIIVLCLSSSLSLAQDTTDGTVAEGVSADTAESAEAVAAEQEEARQQVRSEEEDPQAQKTSEHQQELREAAEPKSNVEAVTAPAADSSTAREEVKSEAEEPAMKREEPVTPLDEKKRFTGTIYGSIRLRYRETSAGGLFGDAGSRVGAEGEWRATQDSWGYARVELGFNVLDELDQLFSPGGSSGESQQGESLFPRLYTVGIETPVLVASYGKSWSTYYKISNFTDRFDANGSSAVGTFNANTDGGATGTGRADQVLQTLAYIDFLPKTWKVNPFNLNIQLQSSQPIPGVDGAQYGYNLGLSAVLDSTDNYALGVAYNRATIDDLENAAIQAAGIEGDAEALLVGARWFDEQRYIGFAVARLLNHEATDEGTYFNGWGSELYARYRLVKGYWLVGGYNWLVPDSDQLQAGQYELLYGVVGLRYSIDDFNRLAYAEWRVDSTTAESGENLGNNFTVGIRWDF